MKIKDLKIGDNVAIEIIEALGDHAYVVSLDGQLLRTRCLLNKIPKVGDVVMATVTGVKPLAFKQRVHSDLHLDLKV